MKRVVGILFCLMVVFVAIVFTGDAKAEIASGTWGVLTWNISDDGVLTVSGKGAMLPFSFYSSEDAWRAYENSINITCSRFTAGEFDKRLLKTFEGDSFENAANKLSVTASRLLEKISGFDPLAFSYTGEQTLTMAQQNVMALLLKFYDEANDDRKNYITDGKKYTMRNEASGLVLTVSEGNIVPDRADKAKAQKFTAFIDERGTFAFGTEDGGFINAKCKGLDRPKDQSDAARFRLAALGNRRFRIMCGGDNFPLTLGLARSGKPVIGEFDPADKGQVWVLS